MPKKKKAEERTFVSLWALGKKVIYEVRRTDGGYVGVCTLKGVILKSRVVKFPRQVEAAMFDAIYQGATQEARQESDKEKLAAWNTGQPKRVSSDVS